VGSRSNDIQEIACDPIATTLKPKTNLFLKARACVRAGLHANGPIVGTGFGESTVTPAMWSVFDVGDVFGEGFVGEGRDVHFLRTNVAANVIWFHESDE
jgi:hypothetical protein